MRLGATARADTRYNFTSQFLRAAAHFARLALQVEQAGHSWPVETAVITEHRAYVVAGIMQACAALEAELHSTMTHGPGHHLGSNGTDRAGRDLLRPLAEMIDRQPVLERYQTVLHLLGKAPFDAGAMPFQHAALLVRLRNELVHYKSKLGAEMSTERLFKSLQALRHPKPPFMHTNMNFFPHHCLSAPCAAWAKDTAIDFLDAFFEKLEIQSPLEGERDSLA